MIALGIVLLIVGIVMIAVEAHVPTLGALAVPGAVALVAGAALAVLGLGGGIVLVAAATVVLGLGSAAALTLLLPATAAVRRRRIRSGPEGLIGAVGVVRNWSEPRAGEVLVEGAIWRARLCELEDGDGALHAGDPVVVERLNGLTLAVRRAEEWEVAP